MLNTSCASGWKRCFVGIGLVTGFVTKELLRELEMLSALKVVPGVVNS